MSECMYELKTPFQYAGKGGEMVDAGFVTLVAPNYKQIDRVTPIKQAFAAALKEKFEGVSNQEVEAAQEIAASAKAEEGTEEEDAGLDSSFILNVLFCWSGKLTDVYGHADWLFRSGVAQLDGDTPVTKAILDKMSIDDFEGMVGAYLANFIIPSLMDGQ